MLSVYNIVKNYLIENKFDGLWNPDGDCGCSLDDFEPCGEMAGNCEAGYLGPCTCGDGCDYHIGPKKKGGII